MSIAPLLFILILGTLIFVHELGHFLVAKWTGMLVDEFAIGFPPRLWSLQRGETRYAINLIPFGGYVKIHGETSEEDEKPAHEESGREPRAFGARPVGARIAVLAAGVTMNVLFAFLVLCVAFSVGFVSIGQDLSAVPGATVTNREVVIASVLEGQPAAKAGIASGDTVVALRNPVNGERKVVDSVVTLQSESRAVRDSGAGSVIAELNRGSETLEKEITFDPGSEVPLGVELVPLDTVRLPIWRAPQAAWRESGLILGITWDTLRDFGRRLLTRGELAPEVSGPIGVYQATSVATDQGPVSLVFLVVALSLNLAVLNLVPIPSLDGGKLIFLFAELIFRRRLVTQRLENALTLVGFSALIGLILVISIRDVSRFF